MFTNRATLCAGETHIAVSGAHVVGAAFGFGTLEKTEHVHLLVCGLRRVADTKACVKGA